MCISERLTEQFVPLHFRADGEEGYISRYQLRKLNRRHRGEELSVQRCCVGLNPPSKDVF